MDEEEIDNWYEEEKEKLTEKYNILIQKSKNNKQKDDLEKKFIKELDTLHKKYESLMNKKIKKNLNLFFFNYKLGKIKNELLRPFIRLKEILKKEKK